MVYDSPCYPSAVFRCRRIINVGIGKPLHHLRSESESVPQVSLSFGTARTNFYLFNLASLSKTYSGKGASLGLNTYEKNLNVVVVASCTALATVWACMRRVLETYKRLSIIAYLSLTTSRSSLTPVTALSDE